MKALVTGISGFIGTKLGRVLADRGHDVMGVSRSVSALGDEAGGVQKVRYVLGEALPDRLVSFSPEVLIHLAWDGIPDFSARTCAENVDSQIGFLRETGQLKGLKRIIVAGSCREYGDKRGLCNETDVLLPDSYFSWAKQAISNYFRLWCLEKNIELLWFRVFYVYGPGQRPAALIPHLIDTFRNNRKPEIKNPHGSNDYIYVDDVLEAFVKGVERTKCSGTLNIGSGRLSTVPEIVQIVESLLNVSAKSPSLAVQISEDEKLKSGMAADIRQSKSIIDWEPRTGLFDGIAKTCEWSAR